MGRPYHQIAFSRVFKHTGFLKGIGSSLRLIPLYLGMIALGAALARYSDSPLLVILFLGALTLVSFAALDYALYILLGFLPFSFRFKMLSATEMQVPTEPLLAAMTVALFLRWIIMARREGHIRFPFRIPFLLYAVSLFLSIINAGNRYAAAKGSLRAMAYMMLAIVVFNVVTDRRRLKWLFVTAIVPATVAVVWTVIFLADRLDIWMSTRAYEGLLFTSYVHYGAFVAVILLILLARSIFDRGKYDRVAWITLLGIFFIGICFSFSRGVWVSFIAAAGFMILQKSTGVQHKRILLIGGGIALFLVLLSLPAVSGVIISRIRTMMSLGYGSNKARLFRWGAAITMFWRHPIIGSGYGSFAHTFVNDPLLQGSYVSKFGMGAHNKYLQTLAETGLVGFSAWMWIIISFFRYGFGLLRKLSTLEIEKPNPDSRISFYRSLVIGTMAAATSMLVNFLAATMIQSDIIGVPFWLLIGLLPAIGNIAEQEIQKTREPLSAQTPG
ncbi:O-antigen ligase family protein [Candidatus Poribacteria bacterium]